MRCLRKEARSCAVTESQPVAFASSQVEQTYAQIEKKRWTTLVVAEQFEKYLLGWEVININADHKPHALVPIFSKSILNVPKWLQQIILRLQKYNLHSCKILPRVTDVEYSIFTRFDYHNILCSYLLASQLLLNWFGWILELGTIIFKCTQLVLHHFLYLINTKQKIDSKPCWLKSIVVDPKVLGKNTHTSKHTSWPLYP